jgi:hypothetical protein
LESGKDDNRRTTLEAEITILRERANNLFPPESESVLPTRLGNVIRAFEAYAGERYGIESVTIWSRLLSVLPLEFLDKVKEVKASFNFLLNTVILLQLLGLELLFLPPYQNYHWRFLAALLSFVISYLIYRAAVSRAIDWGYMFNTAFDLYRRDLLRQLGFRPPSNIEKERELWDKIWYFIMWKETEGLTFDEENSEETNED